MWFTSNRSSQFQWIKYVVEIFVLWITLFYKLFQINVTDALSFTLFTSFHLFSPLFTSFHLLHSFTLLFSAETGSEQLISYKYCEDEMAIYNWTQVNRIRHSNPIWMNYTNIQMIQKISAIESKNAVSGAGVQSFITLFRIIRIFRLARYVHSKLIAFNLDIFTILYHRQLLHSNFMNTLFYFFYFFFSVAFRSQSVTWCTCGASCNK